MDIQFRDIQPATEREEILEFHCISNYLSESPFYQSVAYYEYRESWLRTSQPEEVLLEMEKDLDDLRNMVQFVIVEKKIAGFLWVRFQDIEMVLLGTKPSHAVIYDIALKEEYQRKGIGTEILSYIIREARRKGATLVRSGVGTENSASQRLHEKIGFKAYYVEYEIEV